ncbi:hypothetical protein ONZ45_g17974 [Pleurotus djamor]|nr:hypothetical protein ONZ45_g17974 [Pleurotus djamor]
MSKAFSIVSEELESISSIAADPFGSCFGMGISGLLPLLKSIQVRRHLSDFTGKTVAVDAYVWLHRGVFSCATELATGKKTHKYVDYAMHRALKAEAIPYVVAPYEADAQLAYLERTGIVDAILTEDSDLLVFGCQNVLFKLDDVSSTVTAIARSDFSSVSDPATSMSLVGWNDTQFRSMAILSGCDYLPSIPGIGLKTAWSLLKKHRTAEKVVQVVKMEGKKSVPTGYMKKFRLAEKCFLHQRAYDPVSCRLVHLHDVGEDWDEEADAYVGEDIEPSLAKQIAEGDADPITHLPMEDINPGYIPRVLKRIDLNRDRKGKAKAKQPETPIIKKPPPSPKSGGLFDFFGPKAIIPPSAKSKPASTTKSPKKMVVGKASGKRTLVEVMEQDLAAKRARRESLQSTRTDETFSLSKFFAPQGSSSRSAGGPSRIKLEQEEKENVYIMVEDSSDVEEVTSACNISTVAKGFVDEDTFMEVVNGEVDDPVEQEEGYISPLSSPSRSPRRRSGPTYDFGVDPVSSPISPSKCKKERRRSWSCSSHVETPTTRRRLRPTLSSRQENDRTNFEGGDADDDVIYLGPDLRRTFAGDEASSDIDGFDDEEGRMLGYNDEDDQDVYGEANLSGSTATPSPSPATPIDTSARVISGVHIKDPTAYLDRICDPDGILPAESDDDELDDEWVHAKARERSFQAVSAGWRDRWSFSKSNSGSSQSSSKAALRRSETNVTPLGRYGGSSDSTKKAAAMRKTAILASAKPIPALGTKKAQRKSLTFQKVG